MKKESAEFDFGDLTHALIGCAYRVYNTLGAGFLEKVYERAIEIEVRSGIPAQFQHAVSVYYDGIKIGDYFADIVVPGKVIVELKAVTQLVDAHEVQFVNYLTATKTPVGLLINFGPNGVVVNRKSLHYKPPAESS